ncbi:hypothetical protein MOV08_21025 [Streptomyces yunnanensis]|uniref:Uncharacterized protein n=1 Tax=Streptomyces yunnanensis TaxID=156453 RepID=A0ABY8A9X4_9ACTN|nr:hypothetical protein [Streptomyces yunnanensis]WEB41506.1 hypothetical protein MOV08_21025 [Streptomyces yunnanensis]
MAYLPADLLDRLAAIERRLRVVEGRSQFRSATTDPQVPALTTRVTRIDGRLASLEYSLRYQPPGDV